jgi:UDP-N-acetylmuramoyl-tripeptide--D-alanyl-D-alanine ligase
LDKFLTYGTDKDAGVVAEIELDDNLQPTITLKYEERELIVNLKTFGIGSAKNAIAAAAVAFKFDLNDEEIKNGLEKFEPLLSKSYGRMAVENYGNLTIINDCYNANPSSMELALENLKLMKSDRTKVAVLGDMRELGETSLDEHHYIIEMASKIADIVCIVGEEMDNAFEMFEFESNVTVFENKEDIANFLDNIIDDGLIVLVKGSRGMKMEEVIERLRPE